MYFIVSILENQDNHAKSSRPLLGIFSHKDDAHLIASLFPNSQVNTTQEEDSPAFNKAIARGERLATLVYLLGPAPTERFKEILALLFDPSLG
jgi:hypothetical protein